MKTVIKFPIYVEIESDNVDRRQVTEAAKTVLYPSLLKYLSSAKYRSSILKEFRDAANVNTLDVKLLTEIDLFRERS